MFGMHVTREGKRMAIAEMKNSHLINMIKLVLSKAIEVKGMADAAQNQTVSRYTQRLYGVKTVSPEEAADLTKLIIEKADPYLLEAYLRGLQEPVEMLQKAIGRSERLNLEVYPSLAAWNISMADAEEELLSDLADSGWAGEIETGDLIGDQ
jgi:hypothetical protein